MKMIRLAMILALVASAAVAQQIPNLPGANTPLSSSDLVAIWQGTSCVNGATAGTGAKCATLSQVVTASTPAAALATGVTVPICANGVGCPTTAAPDILVMPFGAAIATSTVPYAVCKVSPAATVTFLVKKWTAGNPASSSTLCTGSISTSCALSSCSISSTSFSAGDGISIEGTEASADASAVISVGVPMVKQ
jgi:hypothetical protein